MSKTDEAGAAFAWISSHFPDTAFVRRSGDKCKIGHVDGGNFIVLGMATDWPTAMKDAESHMRKGTYVQVEFADPP
jgi:hypothetical protein